MDLSKRGNDEYTKIFRQLAKAEKKENYTGKVYPILQGYLLRNPKQGAFWASEDKRYVKVYLAEEDAAFDLNNLPSGEGWYIFPIIIYTSKRV